MFMFILEVVYEKSLVPSRLCSVHHRQDNFFIQFLIAFKKFGTMKVLVILAAVLAVVASYPVVKTWTLQELSKAIELETEPAMQPYLEDALNQIMLALFTGQNMKLHQVVIPSPTGAATWTAHELEGAVYNTQDGHINDEYRNAILHAYNILKQKNATGEVQDSIEVAIPAMDVSVWTSADLNEALNNYATRPDLIPYLEKAQNELKESLVTGQDRETIGMVTPVGYIPHKADYEFLPKPLKNLIKKTKKGLQVLG
ncbi:uncharacterized protein LOC142980104 isoform X2 [Anticarsia gemmatalis]|uniref:uncharacterized protein LOC142980104 isoform X2 n=1 Tax=Anticarsia gemmatalis TaxID=129554 RepID=UPI003F764730